MSPSARFCIPLSSMSLTARFLAFLFVYTMKSICRRARSWRSPTSRLHTTVDAFSLTDSSRKTIKSRFRKLLQTSSLWTVRFFFSISIDRSIHRSIERSLRRKFQRRSTQNVADLSGLFPTVKTCVSDPPLPPPSQFTAHPALATSVRTCIFFSSNKTSDRTVTFR
jgi:hypothetical protein